MAMSPAALEPPKDRRRKRATLRGGRREIVAPRRPPAPPAQGIGRCPTKASCTSRVPPDRFSANVPPTCSALGPKKAPSMDPVTGSAGGVEREVRARVIDGSGQRNAEASIIAEWRASGDMDAEDRIAGRVSGIISIILIDLRGDRALTEIRGQRERNAARRVARLQRQSVRVVGCGARQRNTCGGRAIAVDEQQVCRSRLPRRRSNRQRSSSIRPWRRKKSRCRNRGWN